MTTSQLSRRRNIKAIIHDCDRTTYERAKDGKKENARETNSFELSVYRRRRHIRLPRFPALSPFEMADTATELHR